MIRIVPNIPKITARWAHRASEIPDWLEVPMSDGRTVQYYPRVEQPAFRESIRIIGKMKEEMVGYKRTGERCEHSTGRRDL